MNIWIIFNQASEKCKLKLLWDSISWRSDWQSSRKQMAKLVWMCTAGGHVNCSSHYGNQHGGSSEKLRVDILLCYFIYPKDSPPVSERHLHIHGYCLTIHGS